MISPDSAILSVMVRESSRIAELENAVAERDETIRELRAALSNASTA